MSATVNQQLRLALAPTFWVVADLARALELDLEALARKAREEDDQ